MNGLREKIRNKKGFTLVEMLIVVAIIAILIAVSIPVVGNALEKARIATDAANERAFKAQLTIANLTKTMEDTAGTAFTPGTICVYNADKGTVEPGNTANITKYGQATGAGSAAWGDHRGLVLYGTVNVNGEAIMTWASSAPDTLTTSSKLCGGAELYKTTVAAGSGVGTG